MAIQKLLIIGYIWPEPKTTGAGVRMMEIIDIFQKNNYEITFVSTAEKTNYSKNLNSLNIKEQTIKLNDSSFAVFLKNLNPDVVLFDRFYTEEQFAWQVAQECPQALRVLDTEDLHFLRKARQEAYTYNKEIDYLNSDIAKRELASILRSDITLVISRNEMEILQKQFKIDQALLCYLPFISKNTNTLSSITPDFDTRKNFIFVGNFKHQPNVDAVLELKKSIWPLIVNQLPEAQLYCYGAYAPAAINNLHNPNEGFFIHGWIDDLSTAIKKARVMLAPLRYGAGLKRKLWESIALGTPSVTTPLGCEGISDPSLWNGFIEEDIQLFAKKAVRLYRYKKTWQIAQNNGQKILDSFDDDNDFFISKINAVKNNLKAHRTANFTGTILMHHSMQSTKYLSKWIEEKNKFKN